MKNLEFDRLAFEDLAWWVEYDRKQALKIIKLIQEVQRDHLQQAATENNLQVCFPPLKFCTDNAAMIACAAADHCDRGHFSSLSLGVRSRLSITEVMWLYQG